MVGSEPLSKQVYKEPTIKILPVVFFSSMAGLGFEVLLTRIFSIALWYHFAFMIISIAMLGLAGGGTLLSLFPRLQDTDKLSRYGFCLGISLPLCYLLANLIPFDPVRLSWEKTGIFYLGLYYLILALPFFFTGLIIATAFTVMSKHSGVVYAADLVGAALGSLGILLVMGLIAPERGVFILSSVVLVAAMFGSGRRLKIASLLFIAVNLFLLLFPPHFARLKISPYKELPAALRYPGSKPLETYYTPFARIDTFISPAVRFAPGLSLFWLNPLPPQIGYTVDGGSISAITSSDNPKALQFVTWLPAAVPYEIAPREKVLVLEPGGGLQILLASHYGAREIISIETNPWLVEIIKKEYGRFFENIHGLRMQSGLGRSWLARNHGTFNLIDISMTSTAGSGSFGIAEDYRLTVEAFREYISHLTKDGILCINMFIAPPPRNELRILATVTAAMESMGILEPGSHIAAIRSWGSISILAKRSALNAEEKAAIRAFATKRRFDIVYLPGITAEETNLYVRMPSNEYYQSFSAILSPEGWRRFSQDYIFDVGPVHDDAPFFHYYLRAGKIGEVYRVMRGKWQFFLEEGYIVVALLVQATALSALLILLPGLAGKWKNRDNRLKSNSIRLLPYFAFLGFGFMFVEITLIQKLILPLENAAYAVAAVLTTLLFGSGTGSLLSFRFPMLRRRHIIMLTAVAVGLYSTILPAASSVIAQYRPPVSFIIVFLILFPAGFLMGIPFPTGLKELGDRNPRLIPWAWAINGCCSVLAPLCAILLAMALGFSNVLLLGAVCYVLAFLTLSTKTEE